MGKQLHNPGEDNQKPGKYIERGPRGGEVPKARQVTIGNGDRLPPTQGKGRKWEPIYAKGFPFGEPSCITMLRFEKHQHFPRMSSCIHASATSVPSLSRYFVR